MVMVDMVMARGLPQAIGTDSASPGTLASSNVWLTTLGGKEIDQQKRGRERQRGAERGREEHSSANSTIVAWISWFF